MNSLNPQTQQHSNQIGYGQVVDWKWSQQSCYPIASSSQLGSYQVQIECQNLESTEREDPSRREMTLLKSRVTAVLDRVQNGEDRNKLRRMSIKIKRLELQERRRKEEVCEKDKEIRALEKALESQAQKIQELRAALEEPDRKRARVEL